MKQLSIFAIWTSGDIRPQAGQRVLYVCRETDGSLSSILVGTLIQPGETDYPMYQGRYACSNPPAYWMPEPEFPNEA